MHLVIQSDNTTAQAKNSEVSVFLAYLIAMGFFTTATLNSLQVGHTHEDVDRLFGLILCIVLCSCHWQTPEGLLQLLLEKLMEHTAAKNEKLHAEE